MVFTLTPPYPSFKYGGLEMTTEEILIKQFGASLSLPELALALKSKSANAIRVRMHGSDEQATRLRSIRKKDGRRVYFRVQDVAAFLDQRQSA
jgi:hypothetical protein